MVRIGTYTRKNGGPGKPNLIIPFHTRRRGPAVNKEIQESKNLETFARSSLKAVVQQLGTAGVQPNWHYKLAGWADGPRAISLYIDVRPIALAQVVRVLMGLTNKTMGAAVRQASRLNDEIQVRVANGPQGTLSIEVGKPERLWVYPTPDWPGMTSAGLDVPVGLIADGRSAHLDFKDPNTPAALVAGLPGSGKSNAVYNLTRCLSTQNEPDRVAFLFLDASTKAGEDFIPISSLAHRVSDPVTDPDLVVAALRWATTKLDGSDSRHIFVVVEEATDLIKQKPESAELLSRLGRGGRAAGVHLVQVFHNPIVSNVGERDVSAMIPARLVGRVWDATASRVATGNNQAGAHKLTGKGDMLFVSPSQNLVRVIVPLVRPSDLEKLPRADIIEPVDFSPWLESTNQLPVPTGSPGRNPDPPDFKLVGRLVDHIVKRQRQGLPALAASTLGKKTEPQTYADKMERHLAWAQDVLEGIKEGGL